jgi:cytochrome c oxidase subunit 1
MIASVLVGVPTGIKIINWLATLWRGNITFATPMLFALGLISVFTIGGLTGIMVAAFPFDWQVHDTYFVVAHMHYVLFGGSIFGIFAGLYYWWPKMFGRMLGEGLGKVNFWLEGPRPSSARKILSSEWGRWVEDFARLVARPVDGTDIAPAVELV